LQAVDFKNPVYSEKNARASRFFDMVVCWGGRERERKRRETRKKMRGRKKEIERERKGGGHYSKKPRKQTS
jgi:hypothetical protein